jgi:acyl-CoA thioesterase I
MSQNFLRRRFLTTAVLIAAAGVTACGKKAVTGRKLAAGATVLALGDSITFGTGASADTSYPTVLAVLTGWTVINAGVPGDTSAQALARLPTLLQEHKPALVIVSIGGNDFLRRIPEGETRANIRQICEIAQASGAQVLLVAVPGFSATAAITGSLSDHAMYGEIAQALKLPLHANGWSTVLANPSLKSDQVHANAKGYDQFARSLLAAARAAQLF